MQIHATSAAPDHTRGISVPARECSTEAFYWPQCRSCCAQISARMWPLPCHLKHTQSATVAHTPIATVLTQEFRLSACTDPHSAAHDLLLEPTITAGGSDCREFSSMERLVNGLWATILAVGTVLTSVTILHARSWRFFKVLPSPPLPNKHTHLPNTHATGRHPSRPSLDLKPNTFMSLFHLFLNLSSQLQPLLSCNLLSAAISSQLLHSVVAR